MATINDVAELLSWGATPSWVENQFDKNYKSGTARGTGKNKMAGGYDTYTYTYDLWPHRYQHWFWLLQFFGLGFLEFFLRAVTVTRFTSGGYGIELDDSSLTLTQLAADLTFGEAVVDVQTDTANTSGSQTVSVIDNTEGSTDLTDILHGSTEDQRFCQ